MMAGSHLVLGLTAGSGWAVASGHAVDGPVLAAAALGGLAPDIDHPSSWIGRRLFFVSWPLAGLIGHRGLTHSLLAVIVIGTVLSGMVPGLSLPAAWVQAFLAGYLSHLAGDLLTAGGVPLLWPWRRRFRLLGLTTGGLGELLIVTGLIAGWGIAALCGVWDIPQISLAVAGSR